MESELPIIERHTVSDAWAINTYVRCDIRCGYCITDAQGISRPRRPPKSMRAAFAAAFDAIEVVDRVSVGPYADVYPGPELALGVTRQVLEVLGDRGQTFNLITKGPAVVRDIDIFSAVDARAMVSLNSLDDDALRRHEPGAAPSKPRLAAVHQIHDAGVRAGLQISPWIPGLSDVAEIAERVDPGITIFVTPLRLPVWLERWRRSSDLTQGAVNDAFVREYERVGPRPNVRWSRPPPLDGSPIHISDQLGSTQPDDFSSAAAAPDPGPLRSWQINRRDGARTDD